MWSMSQFNLDRKYSNYETARPITLKRLSRCRDRTRFVKNCVVRLNELAAGATVDKSNGLERRGVEPVFVDEPI